MNNTTRSEIVTVTTATLMCASAAFCGARVQSLYEAKDRDATERALKFVAQRCVSDEAPIPRSTSQGGFTIASPIPDAAPQKDSPE